MTAVQLHAGQLVANGEQMLTIVPGQAKLVADLLAPSTLIGLLRAGQRVLLRYSAFPFQKFGQYWGTISDVSLAALQPDELKQFVPALPPADQGKTFYRVTVIPDRGEVTAYGRAEPLQASMQFSARVVLDRRRLYQWLLDPLYSLHGSRPS